MPLLTKASSSSSVQFATSLGWPTSWRPQRDRRCWQAAAVTACWQAAAVTAKLREQSFGVLQVRRVEALGEASRWG